jgi:chromate transporter
MGGELVELAKLFVQMSLAAVGGANAVVPEIQRQSVEIHHWMTSQEFAALFAIAQAAPGPNVLIVTLVGWHVAGWPGALVTTGAMMGPSSLLTYFVVRVWDRFKHAPWRRNIQLGVAPITVGLVSAGAYLLARIADVDLLTTCITLAVTAVSYFTRLNPLWAFGAAAVAGAILAS